MVPRIGATARFRLRSNLSRTPNKKELSEKEEELLFADMGLKSPRGSLISPITSLSVARFGASDQLTRQLNEGCKQPMSGVPICQLKPPAPGVGAARSARVGSTLATPRLIAPRGQ
jgi:hypothetical protein